nr:uncharacterized protein LOC113826018 [Penaeus vannamei]
MVLLPPRARAPRPDSSNTTPVVTNNAARLQQLQNKVICKYFLDVLQINKDIGWLTSTVYSHIGRVLADNFKGSDQIKWIILLHIYKKITAAAKQSDICTQDMVPGLAKILHNCREGIGLLGESGCNPVTWSIHLVLNRC